MKLLNNKNLCLFLIVLVYATLTVLCLNNCYFWDNIFYSGTKADWFYSTFFKSLSIPDASLLGRVLTTVGFYPPTMSIMTAFLWKLLGRSLWVSHAFVFLWAIILIYNTWKLIRVLFPENIVGWILLITLLETTILSQFSIAGLDIILFAAFVISLRAILEQKRLILSIGIFFLCLIQIRGLFIGVTLLLVDNYYQYRLCGTKLKITCFFKTLLPYLPTFILIFTYLTFYFIFHNRVNSTSILSSHYSLPNGVEKIIRHLLEFGLRSIENGRIAIWLIAIYVVFKGLKYKTKLSLESSTLLLLFLLTIGLYFILIFITQMPFSARYFIPHFFVLTLLSIQELRKYLNGKKLTFVFIIILLFELTGHFWIYPDRIAKSWDCTLAHLPYYALRADCFQYIDEQKLDYKDISGGFCLYGNRRFVELCNTDKIVGTDANRKYFIYSNISNVEDSFLEELRNPTRWIPIRRFEKGVVVITIYEQKNHK